MTADALRKWLAHPLTRGHLIDDRQTTVLRKKIIREKRFLNQIYREWYSFVAKAIPAGLEPILELGSGGGFMTEVLPNVVTSDLVWLPGLKTVLDGQHLPFSDRSLRGIVMIDVLHHIPNARLFFAEAARCVRFGGAIIAVEPWVTLWSKVVYGKFHYEPFNPSAEKWEFPSSGPLLGANGALPWIVFERDRTMFEKEFPQWRIELIEPIMPLRYLLSGGVSMRSLQPGCATGFWRGIERFMQPMNKSLAMFARIVLLRN